MTAVSLLLPNHDNERVLGTVLDRLAANTTYPNVELVIVDDGSTDGSRRIFRDWRESGAFAGEITLIEKEQSGAIDTLNAALNAAAGEICVQLDSDASVETPGWVERMLALMSLDDTVGLITARVVMDSGALQSCGVNVIGPAGVHDRPSKLLEPVGRRRWHHRVDRFREGEGGEEEARLAEVDAGIGCCMMYRRADALAAGGYDANYSPVWFDDIDLGLGIRKLGRKCFYLPDVRVLHHLDARRSPPAAPSVGQRAGLLGRRLAQRLPGRGRDLVEDTLRIDLYGHFSRDQIRRLEHHYAYWREKWGWDFNNPDMTEVERRWGGTELCWATDPGRRAAGEEIVRAFEACSARP